MGVAYGAGVAISYQCFCSGWWWLLTVTMSCRAVMSTRSDLPTLQPTAVMSDTNSITHTQDSEEAPNEHLAWMLQAMEMVCAHIYDELLTLMCRPRKPLRQVRCLSAASSYAVIRQLLGPVIAPTNYETYLCFILVAGSPPA